MFNEFKNQYNQYDKLKILSIICSFKLNKTKVCFVCNTHKSPLWRTGPLGQNTLCNACGIRYKRINNTRSTINKNKIKQKTYHY